MNILTVKKLYKNATEVGCYEITWNNNTCSLVPLDEANRDYQAIQEWIAEGNTVIDNGGGE